MNRNLDGVYFRVQRDGRWESLCFSDLSRDEMEKVLENRSVEWLANLCCILGEQLRGIGDKMDIVCED